MAQMNAPLHDTDDNASAADHAQDTPGKKDAEYSSCEADKRLRSRKCHAQRQPSRPVEQISLLLHASLVLNLLLPDERARQTDEKD